MRARSGSKAARIALVMVVALALAGCDADFGGFAEGAGGFLEEVGNAVSGFFGWVADGVTGLAEGASSSDAGGYEQAKAEARASLEPAVSSSALIEDGTLIVGLDVPNAYLPFLHLEDDGTISGFDVDVAAALADETGLTVRYVVAGSDATVGVTCDVMLESEQGAASDAVASAQYAETATALFRRGDGGTATTADVAGATVAVQANSVSELALAESGLDVSESSYDNLNDCFDALEAGAVDYVACEAYSGAYLAMEYDDVSFAGTVNEPSALSIDVASDNAELQAAVQAAVATLDADGRMAVIRGRWLGGLPSLTTATQIQAAASDAAAEETAASDAAAEEAPAAEEGTATE